MPRLGRRPVIGITAGDPAGIGPEIAAAVLSDSSCGIGAELRLIGARDPVDPGRPSPESSRLALEAMEEAARLAMAGEIQAIVTGPVCKHRLQEVGFAFPGQTEFFAQQAGVEDFAMILTGGQLTVVLSSIHIPLREAVLGLTSASVVKAGRHLADFHRANQPGSKGRLAVAGLNPHAGEAGTIGREEIEILAPAIEELNHSGLANFSGPYSPDTVFCRAVAGEFDGVICLYHDQGLIPLKLHAFDLGVNVTWGLPFVRTSPDHGTAYDLAGKGLARADSMREAVRLAIRLSAARRF